MGPVDPGPRVRGTLLWAAVLVLVVACLAVNVKADLEDNNDIIIDADFAPIEPVRTSRDTNHVSRDTNRVSKDSNHEPEHNWLIGGVNRVKRWLFDDWGKTTEAPPVPSTEAARSEDSHHNSLDEDSAPGGELRKTRNSGEEYNHYNDQDDEDDDFEDGSTNDDHLPDGSGNTRDDLNHDYPTRAVYRVNFVVREPYTRELADRNSAEYQTLADDLQSGILDYLKSEEQIEGNVGVLLIRVLKRSEPFECLVSVDVACESFPDSQSAHERRVRSALERAAENFLRFGSVQLSSADFSFRKLEEEDQYDDYNTDHRTPFPTSYPQHETSSRPHDNQDHLYGPYPDHGQSYPDHNQHNYPDQPHNYPTRPDDILPDDEYSTDDVDDVDDVDDEDEEDEEEDDTDFRFGHGTSTPDPYHGYYPHEPDHNQPDNRYPHVTEPTRYPDDRYPHENVDHNQPDNRYPHITEPTHRYPDDRYPDPEDKEDYEEGDDVDEEHGRYPDNSRTESYPDQHYPDQTEPDYPEYEHPTERHPEHDLPPTHASTERYPDQHQPDHRYPDQHQPDEHQPDHRYPDERQPDHRYPDERQPEHHYPDQHQPDHRYPDERQPDHRYPDERQPEHHYPDQHQPDHRYPDQRQPDQHYPDSHVTEHYPDQHEPQERPEHQPDPYNPDHRPEERPEYRPDQHYPDQRQPDHRYPDQHQPDQHYPDQRQPDHRYPDQHQPEERPEHRPDERPEYRPDQHYPDHPYPDHHQPQERPEHYPDSHITERYPEHTPSHIPDPHHLPEDPDYDESEIDDTNQRIPRPTPYPGSQPEQSRPLDDRCRADDKVRCQGNPHITICDSQRCDGIPDCPDGTDEHGCNTDCEQGEFVCDVTRCIAASQRCDGRSDCDDGTDEHDCPTQAQCGHYEFTCDDGQCIPENAKCDGVQDCSRGEDERDCRDCRPDQFRCSNDECVDARLKCDGRSDCADGSDEHDCDGAQDDCRADEFRCGNGECILREYLCDDTEDCTDGTDEHDDQCANGGHPDGGHHDGGHPTTPGYPNHGDCDASSFRCGDGTCIPDYQHCDRRRDCADGTDEENCGSCTSDQFRCANGVCVPADYVCDGNLDCLDGDDEQDCQVRCSTYEFECDGKCLPNEIKCDGYQDCSDGKDESDRECPHSTHAPTCSPYEFTCGSGECVSSNARCDHRPDCRDHSDERDCGCRPDEYRCSSGECIPDYRRCDRNPDCRDSSDERGCPDDHTAPPPPPVHPTTPRPDYDSHHRCPYGSQPCAVSNQCVQSNQWCDGRSDCADGSDERNCVGHEPLNLKTYPNEQVIKETTYREGREVVFQCRDEGSNRAPVRWVRPGGGPLPPGSRDQNGRLEIPNIQVSQGGAYVCEAVGYPSSTPGAQVTVYLNVEHYTAPTHRPSKACGLHEATCGNGDCIPKHLVCNGEFDCADGSDESRCSIHGCEPNEFRCSNKKCVLKSWRCDADDDCGDNSDEENCATTSPDAACKYHEFACASGDQCVPKAYHCDLQRDCHDGSDERGCTPPQIVQPPSPPMKVLNVGTELVITCVAVGVPTPEISWRLNWGHVPPKCRMTSEGGRGKLVCPDIQKADEGAYSCEAITTTTTVIAVPDLILVVIAGNAVCPAGQFNDAAIQPSECIKCFCFGVSSNCTSADLFTYSIPPPLVANTVVGVSVGPLGDVTIGAPEPQYRGRRPQLTSLNNGASLYQTAVDSRSANPYVSIPDSFSGNQLKSYGGYIKYNVEFRGYGEPTRIPDIILVGNGQTLTHTSRDRLVADLANTISARLFEGHWDKVRDDGSGTSPASREDIMMTLARVEKVLIKMQYVEGSSVDSTISDIGMDSAGISNVGLGPASFVEECRCPAGYSGLSCESCAPGFVRQMSGPWLGHCYREPETCSPGYFGDPARGIPCQVCPCPLTNPSNQFARTCSLGPDGGVVCDCPAGYEGRRCERCSAGYEGNPTQPGDQCRPEQYRPEPPRPEPPRPELCDPAGSLSAQPDPRTGLCLCKDSVTGARCNQCKENAFHLDTENKFGCISCFCMGITNQCTSSRDYRDQISTTFSHSTNEFALIESQRKKTPITDGLQVDSSRRELTYRSFSPARREVYYWSLPSRFLGDKVTSYGGTLNYTIRHVPAPGGHSRNSAHDVELIGNDVKLRYFSKEQPQPNQPESFSIPLLEQYWQRSDGNPVNREHLLMALADLENIFIKATYATMTDEVGLSAVTLETADERNTGSRRASAVEHCTCPAGYVGRSCQDCAVGFTRTGGGLYLGLCEPCECGGHSDSCHPETGECYNCRDNYAGDRCDECRPGYLESGGRCVPQSVAHQTACSCNNNGTVPGSTCDGGRCVCKTNVEGPNCDECRHGTFGLAEDNTEGCLECFCSGATTQCEHGRGYQTEEIPMDVFDHSFTLTDSAATERLRGDDFSYNYEVNEICYDYPPSSARERLFWSLPRAFTGDRVLSYGGHLTFTRRNQEEGVHLDDEDVILKGNGLELHWSAAQNGYGGVNDGERTTYEVPLTESNWRTMTHHYPRPASRSDLMSVLSGLDSVLVRATTSDRMRSACISDVKLDQAVMRFTGRTAYVPVEVCRCPPGYHGTSCQSCSSGHYRDGQSCRQCPCGPNSDSCSQEQGGRVRCHCNHGYSGERCDVYGDNQVVPEPAPEYPPSGKPTITVHITEPTLQIVQTGSTVRLHCNARSLTDHGPVTVRWQKQGGELPRDRAVDDRRGLLVITDVQVYDAGVYVCHASDSYSFVTESATVQVGNLGSAPMVSVPAHVYVDEGASVRLRCEVQGNPRPSVQWTREDGLPFNPTVQVYEEDLSISGALPSDSGAYRCTARSPTGTHAGITQVAVQRAPPPPPPHHPHHPLPPSHHQVWVDTPEYRGRPTNEVILRCRGDQRRPFRWSKYNAPLPRFAVDSGDGQLIIRDANPDDSGLYICTQTSVEGRHQEANVTVSVDHEHGSGVDGGSHRYPPGRVEPPIVWVGPPRHTVHQGDSLQILCEVKNNMQAQIKWTKLGESMPSNVYQRGPYLHLDDCQLRDVGIYVCLAVNPDGVSAQNSTEVYVEPRELPQISIYPDTVHTLAVGGSVILQCNVRAGRPDPTLEWSRVDRRPLGPRAEELDGGVLRLSHVTPEDAGSYICRAVNSAGTTEATVAVEVQVPAQVQVHPNQRELTVQAGEPVLLLCTGTGSPRPNVAWETHSGTRPAPRTASDRTELQIHSAQKSDEGAFTCTARNDAGSDSFTIHLIVGPRRGDIPGYDYNNEILPGPDPEYDPYEQERHPHHRPDHHRPDAQDQQQELEGYVNGTVTMTCRTVGSPHVDVRWVRSDGRPLPVHHSQHQGLLTLQSLQFDDAGDYECVGTGPRGEPKFRVHTRLTVYEPLRLHLQPPRQVVRPGHDAQIICSATGSHEPISLRWEPVDRDMPRSVQTRDGFLQFNRIELADQGSYVCSGRDARGSEARSTAVVLVDNGATVPAHQTGHHGGSPHHPSAGGTRTQAAYLGTSVELRCELPGASEAGRVSAYDRRPPPQVKWDKDGGRGLPRTAEVNGEVLRLANVQSHDAGRYWCSLTDQDGRLQREYVELRVEQPSPVDLPRLSIDASSRSALRPGEDLTLVCQSTEPEDQVSWTRIQQDLPHSAQVDGNTLRFQNIQPEDAGAYLCSARTAYGVPYNEQYNVHVQDHQPPSQYEDPYRTDSPPHSNVPARPPVQVTEARLGSGVSMTCNSDMHGQRLQYAWSKRGFALPNDVPADEQTLHFWNVKESDAGLYTCTVKNGTDTIEVPSILVVTGSVPRFSRSAESYLEYPTLQEAYIKFDFSVTFKPEEQDGLILYNAEFSPAASGDFVSLALVSGVPEFRFNLGSGPAVIRATGHPALRPDEWHTVSVSRSRKEAAMYVDGQGPYKVTSKGKPISLNLKQPLFVGGVPDYEALPDDVPRRGFVGCISGLTLNKRDVSLVSDAVQAGAGVGDCDTCLASARGAPVCHNGGRCQEAREAPGYVCICPEGFSGKDCARSGDACYPGACGAGRCTDAPAGGFLCSCPFGRAGHRCELAVAIAEPSFAGDGYLTLPPPKRRARFDLEIRPDDVTRDGLILYCAENEKGHGDFMSLALKDGHVEFKFDTGSGTTVVRSSAPLTTGRWTRLSAGRMAGEARLTVSGQDAVAVPVAGPRKPLALHTRLYVGGHDQERMTLDERVGVQDGFRGCVKDIEVAGTLADYNAIDDSANVRQCDVTNEPSGNDEDNMVLIPDETNHGHSGSHETYPPVHQPSACDAQPCHNGGLCRTEPGSYDYTCQCPEGYSGRDCEVSMSPCENLRPCQNGGTCRSLGGSYQCYCPLGYSGTNCEDEAEFSSDVSFSGDGYVELSRSLLPHTDQGATEVIALSLSTNASNGLVFWHGQRAGQDGGDKDYIALAVVDSFLEFSFDLGSGPAHIRNVFLRVDDGSVHNVVLKRTGTEASVELDGLFTEYGESTGSEREMDCPGNIYVGGAPDIFGLTGGRYSTGFKGCVYDLEIQDERSIDLRRRSISGVNVQKCTSSSSRNSDYEDDAPPRVH